MRKLFFHTAMISALLCTLCIACTSKDEAYDASGVFETTEVIVSSKATGELLSFDVEEGQNVKEGDTLGLIDTLQLSLKKQQLLSNISATESHRLNETQQVASLQQQISNLQKERARFYETVKESRLTL